MDEVIKHFKEFLFRDLFYFVSGSIIFFSCSLIVNFDYLLSHQFSDSVLLVIFGGVAYSVGVLNQEIWSQTPFLQTYTCEDPGKFHRMLYKRHTGKQWIFDENHRERAGNPRYQRAIDLKQIGSSLGSGLLTSSLILSAYEFFLHSDEILFLAIFFFFLGILFVFMSWLHNLRQGAKI